MSSDASLRPHHGKSGTKTENGGTRTAEELPFEVEHTLSHYRTPQRKDSLSQYRTPHPVPCSASGTEMGCAATRWGRGSKSHSTCAQSWYKPLPAYTQAWSAMSGTDEWRYNRSMTGREGGREWREGRLRCLLWQ
eukprot:1921144-Rhodomonas_salina.2